MMAAVQAPRVLWPDKAAERAVRAATPALETMRRGDRNPMIDLLNDMAEGEPFYEDFSVWGYASTAFWWQNKCATVRAGRHVEIAFRFNLDGLHVKAAWWNADPDQIAQFRSAVAAAESGSELEGLLARLARSDHAILGDVMKRVPRGMPADHPRAGLLKHRSLLVGRELE